MDTGWSCHPGRILRSREETGFGLRLRASGRVLGAADFTAYCPFDTPRLAIRDGTPAPVPRDQWRSLRMEDQVDAVLYLGPRSSMTAAPLSPALCADADYLEMRVRHMTVAGLPQSQVDRLKQDCVSVAPK